VIIIANHGDRIDIPAGAVLEVSALVSSMIDRVFELRSGQTKDYKIGICCFSAKHAALKRKSKDRLADRIDIPAGAVLENKIVSGNLRILDH
jgi:hypothetical protein